MKELRIGSPKNTELKDAFHSLARDRTFRASKLSPDQIIEEIGRRRFGWTIEQRELNLLNQERIGAKDKEVTREARNAKRRLNYRDSRLAKLESKYNFSMEIQAFAPQSSVLEEPLVVETNSHALVLRSKAPTALALLPSRYPEVSRSQVVLPSQVLGNNGHDESPVNTSFKLNSRVIPLGSSTIGDEYKNGHVIPLMTRLGMISDGDANGVVLEPEVAPQNSDTKQSHGTETVVPARKTTREVLAELRTEIDNIPEDEIPVFRVRANGHSQVDEALVKPESEDWIIAELPSDGIDWETLAPQLFSDPKELWRVKRLYDNLSPGARKIFERGFFKAAKEELRHDSPSIPLITAQNNGDAPYEPLPPQEEEPRIRFSYRSRPPVDLNNYIPAPRKRVEIGDDLTQPWVDKRARSINQDSGTYDLVKLGEYLDLGSARARLEELATRPSKSSLFKRAAVRIAALVVAATR